MSQKIQSIMNVKIIILTLCIFCFAINTQAQAGKVFVGNSQVGNAILVKWVNTALYEKDGFLVYRREIGQTDWVAQTDSPIVQLPALDIPAADRKGEMALLEDYVLNNDLTKAEGMSKMLLSMKLVESEAFATFLGLFYKDEKVVTGKTYEYKVTTASDKEVGVSAAIMVKPFEPIPSLKNISLFMDDVQDKWAKFSWTAETERYLGVNVYRSADGSDFQKMNNNLIVPSRIKLADGSRKYPDFFYDLKSHEYGVRYVYLLRPLDFFGREGVDSAPFEVEVLDKRPALAPRDITAGRLSGKQILLTWAESVSLNIKGYNVFTARTADGKYAQMNEELLPTGTSEYVTTIEDWGDYFFYVEVINIADVPTRSSKTGCSILDNVPPQAPIGLTSKANSGSIDLLWTANSEPDLLGYAVFRSIKNDPTKPYERITPEIIKTANFKDNLNKVAQNEFFYKVAAIDTAFNISTPSDFAVSAMPDVTPPIPPTIIKVKLEENGNTIQWLPSMGEPISNYIVYRCNGEDTTNCQIISDNLLTGTTNQFLDETAEKGSLIGYKIIAKDEVGNLSVASNIFMVKTKNEETVGEATSKFSVNYVSRRKQNVVKWKKIERINTKGIMVYRKVAEGRLVPITSLLDTAEEYKDKAVAIGKTYSYQLRTYFNNGTISKSEVITVEVK
jgi:fibronectin type 3 domain-containing protein